MGLDRMDNQTWIRRSFSRWKGESQWATLHKPWADAMPPHHLHLHLIQHAATRPRQSQSLAMTRQPPSPSPTHVRGGRKTFHFIMLSGIGWEHCWKNMAGRRPWFFNATTFLPWSFRRSMAHVFRCLAQVVQVLVEVHGFSWDAMKVPWFLPPACENLGFSFYLGNNSFHQSLNVGSRHVARDQMSIHIHVFTPSLHIIFI